MLHLLEQQLMHRARRVVWQALRQLGLPLQPMLLQALMTMLLQAFWQAMTAALGQVTRSVGICEPGEFGRGVVVILVGDCNIGVEPRG